jgi:5-oxoprolinase (ATP-hydrolysing)
VRAIAEAGRASGWRFWIDRGGTFTDLVGQAPDGRLVMRKVLSEQPDHPGDPAIRALREALALADEEPLPAGLVDEVCLGTTVATNALLERRVEPVLLLVNHGFADLPLIGDQHRPDIFALRIQRPEPLLFHVIEVEGRLAADGSEVEPLGLDGHMEAAIRCALADGYRSCAVALLHSCVQPAHELMLEEWLERRGLGPVILSHRLSSQPRLVPRLATTVAEAALRPVLLRYLGGLLEALGPGTRLRVMTSAGTLQSPSILQAKDTILSGPAGGMVAAVAVARQAGFATTPILGFDMGGTSTDVFHFDGSRGDAAWERSAETEIDGLRIQAPMLPIHTVAAGGGSVLHVDGGRLQVGPGSAGAVPGPACYRRGGPLTITDANLLLGRLPVEALPRVFGPGGDQPPDAEVVRQRFEALASLLNQAAATADGLATAGPFSPEAVAQGARDIAIERMGEAIRRISIQRGHDLRGAVLVSFGGAGGQHACALATSLGIERVLLHPLAGVLSAWGIGQAPQSLLRERSLRRRLDVALMPQLQVCLRQLVEAGREALRQAGDLGADQEPAARALLEIRTPARDQGLVVPWPGPQPASCASAAPALLTQLRQAFEATHRQRYGYALEGEDLVVERMVVEVVAPPRASPPSAGGGDDAGQEIPPLVPLCLPRPAPSAAAGGVVLAWQRVPLWRRECLTAGQGLAGPALVV